MCGEHSDKSVSSQPDEASPAAPNAAGPRHPNRRAGIRVRITLYFALTVLLAVTLSMAGPISMGLRLRRPRLLYTLEHVAASKEATLALWLNDVRGLLSAVLTPEDWACVREALGTPGGPSGSPHCDLRSRFQQLARQTAQIDEVFLIDGRGRVLISSDPARDGQVLGPLSPPDVSSGGAGEQCPSLTVPGESQPVILVCPVPEDTGRKSGSLGVRLNLTALNEALQAGSGAGISVFLVGEDYLLAGRPIDEKARLYIRETIAALAGTGDAGFYKNAWGESVAGLCRHVPEPGATLLLEINQTEALGSYEPAREMLATTIASMAISALVVTVVSLRLASDVTAPLIDLANTARQIRVGNMKPAAWVERHDEIGELARAFNEMVARLHNLLRGEQERREQLERVVGNYVTYIEEVMRGNLGVSLQSEIEGRVNADGDPLVVLGNNLNNLISWLHDTVLRIHQTAGELNVAAAEILSAVTQQVAAADEQSAIVAQVSTAAGDLKTLAEQSLSHLQAVADSSKNTMHISYAGQQAVDETIVSMALIRAQIESVAEHTTALAEQLAQIGEIADVVRGIAARSRMLALNASIEAAHAGEYGKGFAVVAEEVRNLAGQSRQAIAQVRLILSEIEQATGMVASATDEGAKRAAEGVQLAAEAQDAIEQLALTVEGFSRTAQQVVAAGQQQVLRVEQLADAIQSIHQNTVQTLAGTRQMEKAAHRLTRLAGLLKEMVEQYRV